MAAEIKLTMRVPVVGTAPTGGAMRILSLSRQQAYRMQHAADPAEWFPLDVSLGALQLAFICLHILLNNVDKRIQTYHVYDV